MEEQGRRLAEAPLLSKGLRSLPLLFSPLLQQAALRSSLSDLVCLEPLQSSHEQERMASKKREHEEGTSSKVLVKVHLLSNAGTRQREERVFDAELKTSSTVKDLKDKIIEWGSGEPQVLKDDLLKLVHSGTVLGDDSRILAECAICDGSKVSACVHESGREHKQRGCGERARESTCMKVCVSINSVGVNRERERESVHETHESHRRARAREKEIWRGSNWGLRCALQVFAIITTKAAQPLSRASLQRLPGAPQDAGTNLLHDS